MFASEALKLEGDVFEDRMYIEIRLRGRTGKHKQVFVRILLLDAARVTHRAERLNVWNAPTDDVRSGNHLDERHTPRAHTALYPKINGIFFHVAPPNRKAGDCLMNSRSAPGKLRHKCCFTIQSGYGGARRRQPRAKSATAFSSFDMT